MSLAEIQHEYMSIQGSGLCRPGRYIIKIEGHLDRSREHWFPGMTLATDYNEAGSPVTVLTGTVRDQAMLFSYLDRIRDLGLPLIEVHQTYISGTKPDIGE